MMNLLFCACPKEVYGFFTADMYWTNFAPFPPVVAEVPDYTQCTDDNNHATMCTKHAINTKMRADIVTMNAALTNVFLDALLLQMRTAFQQRRLRKPNIIFVDMFLWFVDHYSKTMAKDCKANRQQMAANWHPADGFNALLLHLFTSAAFRGCTDYTMADRNIVDIGLCINKQCRLYANEYKAWIACKFVIPKIVETFDTFKSFWAAKITLVNQTAIPVSMHGYGMATVLVRQVNRKLWGHVRCHPRIREDSGLNNHVNSGPSTGHAAVLHGTAAAAPPGQLRATAATARPLQIIVLHFSR
jgi:hypothetical protein